MKIIFISDIHGIKTNLELIDKKIKYEKFDKLVVLGDLFYNYHDNTKDFDIYYVREFLERYKDKIICITGNCDSDNDLEFLSFPIISSLEHLSVDNLDIYLTHGHIYNDNNWDKHNTILIFGHYHIPFIKKENNIIYINPGSISLPKRDYKPSYLVYENRKFTIYDIENSIINEIQL